MRQRAFCGYSRRAFLLRAGALAGAGALAFANTLSASEADASQLYRSDAGREAVLALYERKLRKLPFSYEVKRVPTRFGQTQVLVLGPTDAPPLLAVHGVHFGGPFMADFVAPLAERFRVYIPDIVGQPGRSAEVQPEAMGHQYAAWLTEVLDSLGVESLPILGISFGGAVVLDLAAVAPHRISKAVLIVPGGFKGSALGAVPLLFRLFIPWHFYRFFPDRARVAQVVHPLAWEMDEDWYDYFDAILRHVHWLIPPPGPFAQEDLRNFHAPVAIYAAREDIFFPGDALIEEARKVIPNLAEGAVFDSSHFPTITMQTEVLARVASFLK